MTFIFDIVPLQIWPVVTFTAILKQKMYHSCFYFPEALLNKFKHGTKPKILSKQAIWFLFEVIRYYHYKVIVICISCKILQIYLLIIINHEIFRRLN